jgi:peptidoglycan/LPS O-acetylase OafA/YrhL
MSSPLPAQMPCLTGIRFFAAAWVVMFHGWSIVPALPHVPVIQHGYLAVPLFFILSGFILSHTYFHRYRAEGHWRFIYFRFARLWPVHVVAMLLLVIYVGALAWSGRGPLSWSGRLPGDAYPFRALPTDLAMVRCWFSDELLWNYPSWSIHSEWFAYLFCFPVAFVAFPRLNRPLLLGGIAIALLSLHAALPSIPGKCDDIVLLFFAGAALYRLRQTVALPSNALAAGAALLIAGGLFTPMLFLVFFGFAALILCLATPRPWLNALAGNKWAVYGGTISYSLYMTHALTIKLFAIIQSKLPTLNATGSVVFVIGLLIASCLFASAMYHVVEAPANVALRRILAKRDNRAVGAVGRPAI